MLNFRNAKQGESSGFWGILVKSGAVAANTQLYHEEISQDWKLKKDLFCSKCGIGCD